jgi:1-deoxy-D-xylulose-5-phosphate synthase
VAIYSTFLQRGFDQVLHDVCIENLDVIFAVDRAGLVGADGATHQGVYDLSYLRALPNMSIAMPATADEMRSMLREALILGGPKAIRWPRGAVAQAASLRAQDWPRIEWGSWEVVREGSRIVILGIGPTVGYALQAANGLSDVGVVNARFIKPLDTELLLGLARNAELLITVEDHALQGGFGSAVLEELSDHGVQVPVHRLGIRERHVPHGNPIEQHEELGYGPQAIRRVLAGLGQAAGVARD